MSEISDPSAGPSPAGENFTQYLEKLGISPEPWIINGVLAGGMGPAIGSFALWRVDSISESGPVGLEFLKSPLALVPKKENAQLITLAPRLLEFLLRTKSVLENLPLEFATMAGTAMHLEALKLLNELELTISHKGEK